LIRGNRIEDSGSGTQRIGIRVGRHAGTVRLENNSIQAIIPIQDDRPPTPNTTTLP